MVASGGSIPATPEMMAAQPNTMEWIRAWVESFEGEIAADAETFTNQRAAKGFYSEDRVAEEVALLRSRKTLTAKCDVYEAMEAWGRAYKLCLLYTSPSPRDRTRSRMPSSA